MNLMPNMATLYKAANQAYMLLPYYCARGGSALPPWHFFLEVTRRCNLRCVMCQYIEWLKKTPPAQQKEGELTSQEWLDVIRQVPRLGLISFTGGEPFVRPDFLDLLGFASSRCRTHVITNATMLTEDRIRTCVELAPKRPGGLGFNVAGISLEGPQETHDSIRGEGAYAKTMAAIKMLAAIRNQRKRKCPIIHTTTVIQKGNLDHLSWMPQLIADAGADVMNLTLEVRSQELQDFGTRDPGAYKASQLNSPRLDPQRVADALRDTRMAAQKAGIELRTPDMPDAEIVRYYCGQSDLRQFRCPSLWSTIIIGSKGNIFPCWMTSVGNVREMTMKQAWNGPEFRKFRCRVRDGLFAPCAGCCNLSYHGTRGSTGDNS